MKCIVISIIMIGLLALMLLPFVLGFTIWWLWLGLSAGFQSGELFMHWSKKTVKDSPNDT